MLLAVAILQRRRYRADRMGPRIGERGVMVGKPGQPFQVAAGGIDQQAATGVRLRHVQTGEVQVVPATGFFVAIGHAPGHMLITDRRDADYLVP